MHYDMNKKLSNIISVITQLSRSYKIVTAITLLVNLVIFVLFAQPLVQDDTKQSAVMVRALLDTLVLFAANHFFVRTYLKLNIVNRALTIKRVSLFLGYMLVTAAIFTLLSLGIGKIEMLKFSDITGFQFNNDSGSVAVDVTMPYIIVIAIFNSFFMLLAWAIAYLFWVQQINRKKQQQQMHKAQLQQLTNQLNPHFLFNALNSIRALIYEDQDKAADTVTLLSELFRTHLKAHLNTKSSLEEELEISANYLAIEKVRLEERLHITTDIDPQLLHQILPTLTLLTLVENAIKHGISPNKEAGNIDISATIIDNQRWLLRVNNSVNATSNADGTSTGINNVKKRLRLMFDRKYQWQQTIKDGIYSIAMELPRD